jgi:hypothetical protein
MTHPTLRKAIETLEVAYEFALNLFPEEMADKMRDTRPVIVIQTHGRRSRVLGWHEQNRWQEGKNQAHEITIAAESLKDGFYPVLNTLIHEMVHHGNKLMGVKDVSANQYHNRKFADLAEEIGLFVEKGQNGFGHTPDMTAKLKKTIREWGLDRKAFKLSRRTEVKPGTTGSKLRKYECQCGYGIRIAINDEKVDLSCNICGSPVEEQF